MKATGIVRNVDNLGRVVLPKDIRSTLGISTGDPLEIFIDGDTFVIKKFDRIGDMEQLIDNVESTLMAKKNLVPSAQFKALLNKVEEMRAIIMSGQD